VKVSKSSKKNFFEKVDDEKEAYLKSDENSL
jgi:hypothetical protein